MIVRKPYIAAVLATLLTIIGVVYVSEDRAMTYGTGQQEEARTAKLVFVGDIMLSRAIGSTMVKQGDWSYSFGDMATYLSEVDLAFGNLEGPISNRGTLKGSIYSFRADPRSVEGLVRSGFDVMSVANNHIWDYGEEAFDDTLQLLEDNGIRAVGGGRDFAQAHAPVIKDANGAKVAFLAYSELVPGFLLREDSVPAIAYPDPALIAADIQKARAVSDIVIVSFHWGEEYQTLHNASQERLAYAAIDAGASLVVGHHPHVPQDTERYKDGFIAYSLGNFVFDQNFSAGTRRGLVLEVALKGKKIDSVMTREIKFSSTYQPSFVSPTSSTPVK